MISKLVVGIEQRTTQGGRKRRQQSGCGPGICLNQSPGKLVLLLAVLLKEKSECTSWDLLLEEKQWSYPSCFYMLPGAVMPAYASRVSQESISELRCPSEQQCPLPSRGRSFWSLVLGAAEVSRPCCWEALKEP